LVLSYFRKEDRDTAGFAFDGNSLAFLLQASGITTVSLAIMYWGGPLAVELFGPGGDVGYRQMRGSYPFKLVGFALGGFIMVYLITALVEGQFKRTRVISSLLAVAALIVLFDLPFDSVLLPPNGDW
jgi:hypothetical protein